MSSILELQLAAVHVQMDSTIVDQKLVFSVQLTAVLAPQIQAIVNPAVLWEELDTIFQVPAV